MIHGDNIYQLAVEADNEDEAREIFEIFRSCINVVYGTLLIDTDSMPVYFEVYSPQNVTKYRVGPLIFNGDLLSDALPMIINALEKEQYSVALLKYCASQCLYPVHYVDFSTNKYQSTINGIMLIDHIMMGYSIIISYSIIEELGLDVRATKDNPSSINGKWNPGVISSLRSRLVQVGVNPDESIDWLSRAGSIRPFKKETVVEGACEWNNGTDILDVKLNIVDAILEISYVRSCLAAHANTFRLRSIHPIDVQNANHLARILLMDVLKKS
jgi:hypothetical protein